ncbi:MAG: hypothetical protein AOA65_0848 [Candidatus Bathyarchaeota archaeon BA1]|nr:MAG: hypothetical protein AOA65_0848 [Candidatus Bathyarchaeota archaeon BA1]
MLEVRFKKNGAHKPIHLMVLGGCCRFFNADYNAALNVGLPLLAKAADRGATVELAQTEDEQAREIVARKLGSQHCSAVGSSHITYLAICTSYLDVNRFEKFLDVFFEWRCNNTALSNNTVNVLCWGDVEGGVSCLG